VSVMNWRVPGQAPCIEGFVFRGRVYTNVADVIADLAELIDLDEAVFDYRLLIPVFRFIGRIVGAGGDDFTADHERAIVPLLRARITAHRGYRLNLPAAPSLELPGSSIVEVRVELAGAALALAEMGMLSEARDEVAELCRQIGRNVLALVKKRPELLYRFE